MILAVIIFQFILIGGLVYRLWIQHEKDQERIDTLLKYIKPDTYTKNKGANEIIKQMQGFLFEQKQQDNAKEQFDKEIKMINAIK